MARISTTRRKPKSASSSKLAATQSLASLTNEQLLTVWSKAVDTQMHFNEMAVKSRQLGLTFVAAALGVGVVLLGQNEDFSIPLFWGLRLHVTVLLVLAAWLALRAVRKLDLGVYHQMLRGAVAFGRDIEAVRLASLLGVNKGMTEAVTFTSQNKCVQLSGVPLQYSGTPGETAGDKVAAFYKITGGFLLAAAAILAIVTNLSTKSVANDSEAKSPQNEVVNATLSDKADQANEVRADAPLSGGNAEQANAATTTNAVSGNVGGNVTNQQ